MTKRAGILIDTDAWEQGPFEDRDGSRWQVRGRCETDRCGAVCCKVADWRGVVGKGPCEMLQGDLRCAPHAERGPGCKPASCLAWPLRQVDIDATNEIAERLGFAERCHLEVIPWQPSRA